MRPRSGRCDFGVGSRQWEEVIGLVISSFTLYSAAGSAPDLPGFDLNPP